MKLSIDQLKRLLVPPGHITEDQFGEALKIAKDTQKTLDDVLIGRGFIEDEQLGKLISEQKQIPFVNLRKEAIDQNILSLVPEVLARSKGVIAFSKTDKGIKVGMVDPEDLEIVHSLEKRLGANVIPYLITKRDLRGALALYKKSLGEELEKMVETFERKEISKEAQEEVTGKILDTLLQYGYHSRASDIHIEPHLKNWLGRFRVDGVMHDIVKLPKELGELILTRIKVLAKMRVDEHRTAQDGRFGFEVNEERMDIRVSVMPIIRGENVVMRILSATVREFTLANLGLHEKEVEKIYGAIATPHGMILVSGPTGSGKTTTVYSMIKVLNRREVHIASIEDPVEYEIEGVSQIQVNPHTDLTFAKGLRAIVRQDPDIILVGEIRDTETAEIAVNAAMTGHLVLSTLHANDASTSLTRLLEMGIEPFLVSSTVNITVAQRLVRKICERCRISYVITKEEQFLLENDPLLKAKLKAGQKDIQKLRLYKGGGCEICAKTGYVGRIGTFEVLKMSDKIKELIMRHASADEMSKIALQEGMTTMLEDGLEKVFNGITTLEELLRVVEK